MKRLLCLLAALLVIAPVAVFAETGEDSSQPVRTTVGTIIAASPAASNTGKVLVIGGRTAFTWKDCAFDLYPLDSLNLGVEDALVSDWSAAVSQLSAYSPEALVVCFDGSDDPDAAAGLIASAAASMPSVPVYAVVAPDAGTDSSLCVSVSAVCASRSTLNCIITASYMLGDDDGVDSSYLYGSSMTSEGWRVFSRCVADRIIGDLVEESPVVSVSEAEESTAAEEKTAFMKYRWLIAPAILAAAVLFALDTERIHRHREEEARIRKERQL